MRGILYVAVLAVSTAASGVFILKLLRTSLWEPVSDWWFIGYFAVEAACFFAWFILTDTWFGKLMDGLYVIIMVIQIHNWWDRRKRRKKPSRSLGRVVNLGHRLAVVNDV